MKVRYHVIAGIVLVLGLVIEVILSGEIGSVSGLLVICISSFYLYHLAKNKLKTGFILVILVNVTATYMLAKPYYHYGINQYDYKIGGFIGEPHVHRLWEADHVH